MEAQYITTPDNIKWYVERYSPNPTSTRQDAAPIVLIPSGEGDCSNLGKTASLLKDSGFEVVTFDNPGFSRTEAPKEAYNPITPQLIAKQITTLLDKLEIKQATFFGNSSGAGAVLAILALYPERAERGIIHECPFASPDMLKEVQKKSDEEVSAWCAHFFVNGFVEEENEGREKWRALGKEYHDRLEQKNYVVWMRCLVNYYEAISGELATEENLKKRPIYWTVGGLSDPNFWASNWEYAKKGGIEVRTDVLNCKHFPYVSIPEKTADWIVECIEKK